MPFIVIADELDEDEAKLAAKNCGVTYGGHIALQKYVDGIAEFDGNSENHELLESICIASKFKNSEHEKITTIELTGNIKNTLQLKLKYADKFLGEVNEDCLESRPEQNSLRYMSADLKLATSLRDIRLPSSIAEKLDLIAYKSKDVKLNRLLTAISQPLMNWESFADEAIELLVDKAEQVELFKP